MKWDIGEKRKTPVWMGICQWIGNVCMGSLFYSILVLDCSVHMILIKKVKKVQVFDTPQVSTVLRSNLMRLYFPVDLTGNLIMIEKLVSGGT